MNEIIVIISEILGLVIILSAIFNWKLFRYKKLKPTDKVSRIARFMIGILCLLTAFVYWKFDDNVVKYWYYMELILFAVFAGIEAGGEKQDG